MKSLVCLGWLAVGTPLAQATEAPLTLQVQGQCVDQESLLHALAAERGLPQQVPLRLQVDCNDGALRIEIHSEHGSTQFEYLQQDFTQEKERELALLIAEHESYLASESRVEKTHPTTAPASEPSPPKVNPAESLNKGHLMSNEAEKPPLDHERKKGPDPAWAISTGPLLRFHFAGSLLLGGGVTLHKQPFVLGLEAVAAHDNESTAQDIGGTLAYSLGLPLTHRVRLGKLFVRGDFGLKLRVGYSRFAPSHAVYAGGALFYHTDISLTRTYFLRLGQELGRGGFSQDERLSHIQSWYTGWTVQVGRLWRSDPRSARVGLR